MITAVAEEMINAIDHCVNIPELIRMIWIYGVAPLPSIVEDRRGRD